MEISIKIKNDKIYANAAFILDQDQLFNKIIEIREYWRLTNNLIPHNEFNTWLSQNEQELSLTPEVKYYEGSLPDFSFTQNEPVASQEFVKELIYSSPLDLELEHLLRKNGLPPNFKNFILRAIVCGEVSLIDWEETKNDEKFPHDESLFKIPPYVKLYIGDTKPQIRRDREWYWESKRGKKPLQIAKETSYLNKWELAEDYRQNVKNGISRYELFLRSQGTF